MLTTTIALILLLQENAAGLIASPESSGVEPAVNTIVLWLKFIVETTGAVVIAVGVFLAIVELFKVFRNSKKRSFTSVRLVLASYLALALEFQLAADILATAIGPTWDQLGRLAAIAVIRTALNYFLSREIRESEEKLESAKDSETQ